MSESECYIKMEKKNFIVQFPENGSYAKKNELVTKERINKEINEWFEN